MHELIEDIVGYAADGGQVLDRRDVRRALRLPRSQADAAELWADLVAYARDGGQDLAADVRECCRRSTVLDGDGDVHVSIDTDVLLPP